MDLTLFLLNPGVKEGSKVVPCNMYATMLLLLETLLTIIKGALNTGLYRLFGMTEFNMII
jgi:hypothetical protein